MKIVMVSNF